MEKHLTVFLHFEWPEKRHLTFSFLIRAVISLSLSSICPFSLSPSLTESDNLQVDAVRTLSRVGNDTDSVRRLKIVTDLKLSSLFSASVLIWKFIISATRSLSCCSSWTRRAFSRSRARAAPPSRLCSLLDRLEQDTWTEWDARASSLRMSDKSLWLEGGWQRGQNVLVPTNPHIIW